MSELKTRINYVSGQLRVVARGQARTRLEVLPSNAMTKSHSGSKHVSLVRLPVSYNLLSPNVAQVDDAIQIKPLVRSSAWKEIRIRAACSPSAFPLGIQ